MEKVFKQINSTKGKYEANFFSSQKVGEEMKRIGYYNAAKGDIVHFGYIVEDNGVKYPILVDGEPFYVHPVNGIIECGEDTDEAIFHTIAIPIVWKCQLNYVTLE